MEAMRYKRLLMLMIFFVFFIPASAFAAEKSGWHWIKADKVQEMLKEGSGLWLIDVRNSMAYEAEHIEGSVNIAAVSLAYKKFPPKRTLIVADDSLGLKAAKEAAELLIKNGHERVYILEGGVIAWELDGYPFAKISPFIRGVNAEEFRWALSNKVALKIFDMRGAIEREKGKVQNSEPVEGNNISEKIERLKETLKKGQSKDLAGKLKKPRTVILVFSASEDAQGITEKLIRETKSDIRYLIGGYETMFAKKSKDLNIGECPTCPAKGK